MTKPKLGLPTERRMVRAEFHDGFDTHGAGESGVAAALCHRGPRRGARVDALGRGDAGGCVTLLRVADPRSVCAGRFRCRCCNLAVMASSMAHPLKRRL